MGYILPCSRALTIWGFSICFTWKLCWPAVWAASCATFDVGNETSTSSPFLLLFHLYCFWPFKWRKIQWIKKLCMCIYVHLDPKTKKKEIGHTICSYNIFFAFWCSGYFMSILKIFFQANWLQNVVPDNIFQIVAMDHFYSLLFWTIFCPILQIPFPDNIFGQTAVMDNIFANCRCEWVTCKFWRLSFKSSL